MTDSTTESKKTATKKTASTAGEQKRASGERIIAKAGGSGLASGPSQDDLNPAYAPPKEDADNADAKS